METETENEVKAEVFVFPWEPRHRKIRPHLPQGGWALSYELIAHLIQERGLVWLRENAAQPIFSWRIRQKWLTPEPIGSSKVQWMQETIQVCEAYYVGEGGMPLCDVKLEADGTPPYGGPYHTFERR